MESVGTLAQASTQAARTPAPLVFSNTGAGHATKIFVEGEDL